MDLVPILPTHIIHALDTGHLLCLYHLKLYPLGPYPPLIISSSFPYLCVSWVLEVLSSTPSHLMLPYKLNAVDYTGKPVDDSR